MNDKTIVDRAVDATCDAIADEAFGLTVDCTDAEGRERALEYYRRLEEFAREGARELADANVVDDCCEECEERQSGDAKVRAGLIVERLIRSGFVIVRDKRPNKEGAR